MNAIEALEWLRSEIIALCEDTEDRFGSEPSGSFNDGRRIEAKSIRRTIGEIVRCRLSELREVETADSRSDFGSVAPGAGDSDSGINRHGRAALTKVPT